MDIRYLLLLQNLREATQDICSPFLMWISDFAIGFWPIAMAAMIFWAFDRRAGKRLLSGYAFALLANGFLKLTFRITRPWLRDERVLPYGDSKVTATGYSFPSGHSTWATSLLGGTANWFRQRRNYVCASVLLIAMLLVMFSRNYLGVHTPQDVLVGFASSALMVFCAAKLEDWTDKDIKRDVYVIIGGLVLCVVAAVYYFSIVIEPVYNPEGVLVVDPAKMRADSFEGIGLISSFVICRYFERRCFHFDTEKSWKDRFVIGVFALIPLYLWVQFAFPTLAEYDRSMARFISTAGTMTYILILVPFAMSKITIPEKN